MNELCPKHRFRLMFTTINIHARDIGSWWTFECRYCGSAARVHSSKFWAMFA
jgi:hypothetical protein